MIELKPVINSRTGNLTRCLKSNWRAKPEVPGNRGQRRQEARSVAQMIQRSNKDGSDRELSGPNNCTGHPTWSLSASDPFLWSPDVASLQYASGDDPDTDQEGSSDRVSSSHVQSEQQASKRGTCGLPQTVGGVSQTERRPGLLLLSLGYKRSEVWRDQRHTERQ